MEHRITKIYQDTKDLTKEDWEHIQNCEICLQEYKIASFIEQAIEEIPLIEVPIKTEIILIKTTYRPKNFYIYFFTFLILILSFPSLTIFTRFSNFIYFLPIFFLYTNLFFIFLFLALLIVFSMQVFTIHKEILEKYSEKFDAFLEKS